MKKYWIVISAVVLVAIIIIGLVLLRGNEDSWVCNNGTWVKHGQPRSEMPSSVCPVATTTQLANPASVNCKDKGGQLVIKKRGDGGEYGLCYIGEGLACEEWTMLRGDCPEAGAYVGEYNGRAQSEEQIYCVSLGGAISGQTSNNCTFKDGSECFVDKLFNGVCNKGDQITTTFKTYQNSKYGFEFSYPSNWLVPQMSAGEFTGGYPRTTSKWRLGIGPIYEDYYGNKGYSLYLSGLQVNNYAESLKALKSDELVSAISEKTINGNRVVVFNESGMVDFTKALIFGPKQMIELEYDGNSVLAGRFEEILASFKFTN